MHIGTHYPLFTFLKWTSGNLAVLVVIAAIPTVLYAVFGVTWIVIPWVPVALVGTAAAFIAGFRNTQTYNRLWEARQIWGAIVNDSRFWGVASRDYVIEPGGDTERARAVHLRLNHRHIAWLTALRYQLRARKPWENMAKSYNVKFGEHYTVPEWTSTLETDMAPYLTTADATYVLAKQNRATQLLALQSAELKELHANGWIAEYPYVQLLSVIKDFYTHQGKAERIKNFPYPRQFTSINLFFVWLLSILLPFGMLDQFAGLGEYAVWLTIPFTVVVGWVFTSLERVGEATENPFEGSPNDIPMASLSRTIEIDMREMLEEMNLPAAIGAKNEIVM